MIANKYFTLKWEIIIYLLMSICQKNQKKGMLWNFVANTVNRWQHIPSNFQSHWGRYYFTSAGSFAHVSACFRFTTLVQREIHVLFFNIVITFYIVITDGRHSLRKLFSFHQTKQELTFKQPTVISEQLYFFVVS